MARSATCKLKGKNEIHAPLSLLWQLEIRTPNFKAPLPEQSRLLRGNTKKKRASEEHGSSARDSICQKLKVEKSPFPATHSCKTFPKWAKIIIFFVSSFSSLRTRNIQQHANRDSYFQIGNWSILLLRAQDGKWAKNVDFTYEILSPDLKFL